MHIIKLIIARVFSSLYLLVTEPFLLHGHPSADWNSFPRFPSRCHPARSLMQLKNIARDYNRPQIKACIVLLASITASLYLYNPLNLPLHHYTVFYKANLKLLIFYSSPIFLFSSFISLYHLQTQTLQETKYFYSSCKWSLAITIAISFSLS